MNSRTFAAASAVAVMLFAGTALAQTSATATTDLNVRAGPGSQYPIVGQVGANQSVVLDGCAADSKWCATTVNGAQGWVYSDYLTADFGGSVVTLTERPASAGVPVTEYKGNPGGDGGALAGAATGAVAGALIGGPVGAAVGGVAGAAVGGAAGTVFQPTEAANTYVRANTVDPVYLDGEVVVGAGLPETVELREIPDYEYRYTNINGQPVLIDPGTRRIVYVYR